MTDRVNETQSSCDSTENVVSPEEGKSGENLMDIILEFSLFDDMETLHVSEQLDALPFNRIETSDAPVELLKFESDTGSLVSNITTVSAALSRTSTFDDGGCDDGRCEDNGCHGLTDAHKTQLGKGLLYVTETARSLVGSIGEVTTEVMESVVERLDPGMASACRDRPVETFSPNWPFSANVGKGPAVEATLSHIYPSGGIQHQEEPRQCHPAMGDRVDSGCSIEWSSLHEEAAALPSPGPAHEAATQSKSEETCSTMEASYTNKSQGTRVLAADDEFELHLQENTFYVQGRDMPLNKLFTINPLPTPSSSPESEIPSTVPEERKTRRRLRALVFMAKFFRNAKKSLAVSKSLAQKTPSTVPSDSRRGEKTVATVQSDESTFYVEEASRTGQFDVICDLKV